MSENLTAVDQLISALSASGIPFTRDMWVDEDNQMAALDYGIVEISGTPRQLWGDGRLIEQTITGNVILYVMSGNEANVKTIQDILRGYDMSFYLAGSEYVREENKNRWTWRFEMEEYLTAEEAESGTEGDADGEDPDNGTGSDGIGAAETGEGSEGQSDSGDP